jgi:Cys-tRNA(Pro)/Cys-tRNA(Cys) deacylase
MAKVKKTNAMRILDQNKIQYEIYTYDKKDGKIDGISVAQKIGRNPDCVFKTLVTQGVSKEIYVYIIPVKEELDLKKAARVVGEKKLEMIALKDIQKLTGYIRGGCSPVGMKKDYTTYIDGSANSLEKMIVSGGKIGVQIELDVSDLAEITNAGIENLI